MSKNSNEEYIYISSNLQLENIIQSKIKCKSVKERLAKDFFKGLMPNDLFVSYNRETGEFIKNISTYDLIFKINVTNKYERAYQIGSFIRTIVSLLTKINPNKILIIIDMLSYNGNGNINIRRIIDQLMYVSTSSVILTNVFLVLPDVILNNKLFKKQQKENILMNGVTIANSSNLTTLINNYTPFNIRSYDGKINLNIFNNFDSHTNYVSLEYEEYIFTNVYSPVIHQLNSIPIINQAELKKTCYVRSAKRMIIICIEKVSNIHRIKQLIDVYKLENVIICLPTKSCGSYDGIIKLNNEYNIPYYDIDTIVKLITESSYKNIIAVDIHTDAITLDYNKCINELNDSILIFGYESIGIPNTITKLCNTYLQIESRKSVNVVAALSIILSYLHN